MSSHKCPKCSGTMAEGFLLDEGHGWRKVASWVEGAPRHSWLTGITLRGRRRVELESWRCNRCGFLEQYAPL